MIAQIAIKASPAYRLVRFFLRSFLITSLYKIHSMNATKKTRGIKILIQIVINYCINKSCLSKLTLKNCKKHWLSLQEGQMVSSVIEYCCNYALLGFLLSMHIILSALESLEGIQANKVSLIHSRRQTSNHDKPMLHTTKIIT